MIEIELNNVKKNYGLKNVLDGINFEVKTGERISLIGENGSGKSTVLKIISGIEKQDFGNVNIRKGSTIGYLKQVYEKEKENIIVEEYLKESFKEYTLIENRLRELELAMANNDHDLELVLQKYGKLQEKYIALGGYELEEIFPEEIIENCLLNFGDWLQEKVFFIQIVADTEQDAHKVFVSMNDRGLSLTPAEMLKGFLLSEIEDDILREKSNSLWKQKILSLKDIDVKEDETFIKNWLRAQYAETIRETKKGAVNKDFDIIGTEFHKWVRDNKNRIGLRTSEDYIEFINKFEKYTDIYIKIREAERIYNDKFKYVYYNATNKFTLQEQVILASICSTDTNEIIDKKIDLVSKFLDLYIYSRVVIYKSNDYNTIKNAIFIITKRIRNLSLEDLSNELKAIYQENGINIVDNLNEFRVNGYTKKYIRTMLARITGFIEEKSGLTSQFTDYVNREQTHPYDVEHITPDHYEWYNREYSSKEEFDSYRNNFADLIILKNHINQSLNDKEYNYKVNTYESANGNILGASLGEKVYLNNPEFSKFIKNNNLNFKSYNKFGKDEINDRKILYKQLCDMIWNIKNLNIG